MDINKFIGEHCDFCDYENSKICLSCMKIITYEGVKEGTYHAFCNGKEFTEMLKNDTIKNP